MVPAVQKIHRNRRLDLLNIDRGPSPSHHPQPRQPGRLLLRRRRVRHRHLPHVRQVVRLVRKRRSMKTIPLALAMQRQLRRRSRQRKSRTRHVCTKLHVRCANRWDLCQNLRSENRYAVLMKSAWSRSSRRRIPVKKTPHADPRDCPMTQLQQRKPPRHLNPPNGIRF